MGSSKQPGGTQPLVGRQGPAVLSLDGLLVFVEEGPDKGRLAKLTAASLRIGTAEDNDLVLTDPTVSRYHAVLVLDPNGVVARDLESTNGTLVDGVRIQSAFLGATAAIRVGGTLLKVQRSPSSVVVKPTSESTFEGMLGTSRAMRDLFAMIKQLARTDLPVSLIGETGTGKELLARALHEAGPRKAKRFLVLDCGAVVPELLRSELFGHERGAFTGAERTTAGLLEEAQGGTVFLDEVGEIDVSVQPNLLRALETREIVRIGSRRPISVDFRIVSATNRDLRAACEEDRFRRDLFYRLSCVTVNVPALRERPEDVPILARHFLQACARRHQMAVPDLPADALTVLEKHHWPGNVRELRNVMEALTVFAAEQPITAERVRAALRQSPAAAAAPAPKGLEEAERDALVRALEATGWNRKAAARNLGISPTTMFKKIKDYGLKPR